MPYDPMTGQWIPDSPWLDSGATFAALAGPPNVAPPAAPVRAPLAAPTVAPQPGDKPVSDFATTPEPFMPGIPAPGSRTAPPGTPRYGGAGSEVLNALDAITGYEQRADAAMKPRLDKREQAIRDLERQLEAAIGQSVFPSPGIPGTTPGVPYNAGAIQGLHGQIGALRGMADEEKGRIASERAANRAPLVAAGDTLTQTYKESAKAQTDREIAKAIFGEGGAGMPTGMTQEQALKYKDEQRKENEAKRKSSNQDTLNKTREVGNRLKESVIASKGKMSPAQIDNAIKASNATISALQLEMGSADTPEKQNGLALQIQQENADRQHLIEMKQQAIGAPGVPKNDTDTKVKDSALDDLASWLGGFLPKMPWSGASARSRGETPPTPTAPQPNVPGQAAPQQARPAAPVSNAVRQAADLAKRAASPGATPNERQSNTRLMQIYQDAINKGQSKEQAMETAARAVFGR